ncbi:lymphocyte cytosolic protein 2a isoform X2 [Cynoglossus semilaevis]|uniref:lymphocyte cytosolic protein 2a isoform X2 n=1 Tax=Cynoglossus semilaevis TaxID=244447 RepID=UPI0007DC8498|nr:lymphocyte cytosolic protein 2 isoform X2 [Cynoglossus semilaevis]
MSSDTLPTRTEVTGWSPQQLADFMKRMSLSGCDKAVLKNTINGSRFLNLSDNDLQKFPKTYAPMISKLSSEIYRKEEKRGLFPKLTRRHQEPEPVDVQGWGEDEFDDDHYEKPDSSDDDYVNPDSDAADDDPGYETPPSEPPEEPGLCPALPIPDGGYIDKLNNPPAVLPRPPVSTTPAPPPPVESSFRRDPSPHSSAPASGKCPTAPPQVIRANKPGRDSRMNLSPVRGPQISTTDRPNAPPWKPQLDVQDPPARQKPPILPPPSSIGVGRSNSSGKSPHVFNRFDHRKEPRPEAPQHNTFPLLSKSPLLPRSGHPGTHHQTDSCSPGVASAASLPHKLHTGSFIGSDRQVCHSPQTGSFKQQLDPRWYVGQVTRAQAEGCLRQVHKDGAYLVRDSTRQLENQPFTLMVFYHNKVYNVQIRQQNQQYLLGTGLKVQETFPSVSDIISHYSQSPLLLINAKDRHGSQQNQCLLSDPAGFYMGRQTWS